VLLPGWCWCRGLCYSHPFDVIFRSACQCCLEIKKFSVLEQIVLVYRTLCECRVAACFTGSALTQKTAPTESVSVDAWHDQVVVVSRAKSRSMYRVLCNSVFCQSWNSNNQCKRFTVSVHHNTVDWVTKRLYPVKTFCKYRQKY